MPRKGSGKLKVTLPSDTEILLTREFDAPPELVFEASSKPEYVRRWWPCVEGSTMTVCEIDLRVGGGYRYVMSHRGEEIAFHGTYREIVPNKRIVHTEVFEKFPDTETINTVVFEPRGGKTLLTTLQKCPNKMVRDAIISSGMESGADLAFDLLEGVARELTGRSASAPAR